MYRTTSRVKWTDRLVSYTTLFLSPWASGARIDWDVASVRTVEGRGPRIRNPEPAQLSQGADGPRSMADAGQPVLLAGCGALGGAGRRACLACRMGRVCRAAALDRHRREQKSFAGRSEARRVGKECVSTC